MISRHIHITGIVQGVGFRPFIYNLAKDHNLTGWVRNSASGVDIEVTGNEQVQNAFLADIRHTAPPLSQIDEMVAEAIELRVFSDFTIIKSEDQDSDFIPVSPDVAVCSQCQAELFNPQDRRFRYPFINCTNCGPRFSIIKDIPYDRPQTTMAGFAMCPDCLREYENPQDRRFHAQPIACPKCGPQVWLEVPAGTKESAKDQAVIQAQKMLSEGKILAIKGLGGFHLACDATNPAAVDQLRKRKKRSEKPFALMAFDLETIQKYAVISEQGLKLLTSPQAPIVLLPVKPAARKFAESVAPGQKSLGFMLPYTPLHLLLLEPGTDAPEVLVMTSGNMSEEPIVHEDQSAREKLGAVADGFLLHDRPIHRRIDDSVFALVEDQPYPVRRARGYAPNPIRVTETLPQILATGPHMKNTFCLTRDRYAFVSHYIGEMENWETYQDYLRAIQHYEALFRIHPIAIGYDLHPDYLSTRYALERANREHLPLYPVQHHHAHLAAGMIENGLSLDQTVAGFIYDGTGFGTDGTIWGGEVLIGNCKDFSRHLHLKPVPLPGNEVSIRKPARMALSMLWANNLPWDPNLPSVQALSLVEQNALRNQLEKNINAPLTSSMGRLFDAVAALIGLRQSINYEAQAAIELEALADDRQLGYYPWEVEGDQIIVKPTLSAILTDLSSGVCTAEISAKFHQTLAQMTSEIASQIHKTTGIRQFVLSGGVWQNRFLLERTLTLLRDSGFEALIHHQLPPNDGCIAFGQAMIASYRYMQEKE